MKANRYDVYMYMWSTVVSSKCTRSSPASSADSVQELGKYLDEYEAGKAEIVNKHRLQLKLLLKDKLRMLFDSAASPVQPRPNSCDSLLDGVTAGTFRRNNIRPHIHVFFLSAHASISKPELLDTFHNVKL
jgi:hypothetical protein